MFRQIATYSAVAVISMLVLGSGTSHVYAAKQEKSTSDPASTTTTTVQTVVEPTTAQSQPDTAPTQLQQPKDIPQQTASTLAKPTVAPPVAKTPVNAPSNPVEQPSPTAPSVFEESAAVPAAPPRVVYNQPGTVTSAIKYGTTQLSPDAAKRLYATAAIILIIGFILYMATVVPTRIKKLKHSPKFFKQPTA